MAVSALSDMRSRTFLMGSYVIVCALCVCVVSPYVSAGAHQTGHHPVTTLPGFSALRVSFGSPLGPVRCQSGSCLLPVRRSRYAWPGPLAVSVGLPLSTQQIWHGWQPMTSGNHHKTKRAGKYKGLAPISRPIRRPLGASQAPRWTRYRMRIMRIARETRVSRHTGATREAREVPSRVRYARETPPRRGVGRSLAHLKRLSLA